MQRRNKKEPIPNPGPLPMKGNRRQHHHLPQQVFSLTTRPGEMSILFRESKDPILSKHFPHFTVSSFGAEISSYQPVQSQIPAQSQSTCSLNVRYKNKWMRRKNSKREEAIFMEAGEPKWRRRKRVTSWEMRQKTKRSRKQSRNRLIHVWSVDFQPRHQLSSSRKKSF